MRSTRSRIVASLAAAAVAVAILAGWYWHHRRAIGAPSAATPVILISIDTLRSDHLPAYGYTRVATPNIDALRGDSILYRRAYSHTPLTLPSHASILTGMLPGDNGVRDNVGYRLDDSVATLPELLRKNGYATGASVSAFVLRHETRISRGFDFYDDDVAPIGGANVLGRIQRVGNETLDAARKWLDERGEKPFFFFLHLYDPHTPYTPPEPYKSRYASPYDGEIAFADSVVGRLIDDLKQKGIYDRALIVLLSDHGEGLNEHGEEEHGFFLYREDLQVPLMVKLPGSKRGGAVVMTPVQLVDVFPTILERTATPPPKAGHRIGQSLLSFVDGGPVRPIYAETYYARFHFGWSDIHSLIEGNDHYIHAPIPELYDLAADPGEKRNGIEQNRRRYVRMRSAIAPLVTDAQAPANIDPETAAKLAALGYVGSTVQTGSGEVLPDPKTMLPTFREIRLASTLFHNEDKNDLPEALRVTERLLAANGKITDLWDLKSKILWKLGRQEESMETAREGLRHVPGAIALLFDVANVGLALKDLDTAEQHAEIAAKTEPGQGHEILARIALLRGNPERAAQEARLAMQSVQDPTKELMILGGIEMDRKSYSKALEYYDQAFEHVKRQSPPRLQNLHLNRGDALARLERPEEAEREFRAEIADFPSDVRAYSSLIILLVTHRRTDEATKLVFEVVKASPQPHTYVVVAETLKAIGDDRGAMFWTYQGLQQFPNDDELRRLPKRLAEAGRLLRNRVN